jgi:hypothetical protein
MAATKKPNTQSGKESKGSSTGSKGDKSGSKSK